MLDIIELLLDKLEYIEQQDEEQRKSYMEDLAGSDENERANNWRNEEVNKLTARLTAAEAVQKALEKLI